ncbi:MAG: NAD-dependent epimerase/dehydratase family protein [Ectobacillus sp.]
MKILITGGAGFIGSHIADALKELGHVVAVVDNLSSGKRSFVPSGVVFYQQDICKAELEDIFRAERPEIVIHQAAQVSVSKSMLYPAADADVNVMGTVRVLDLSVRYGVRKFIFASTAALYGIPECLPLTENDPVRPISFYGLSKAAAEAYIRLYGETFGLPYTILRYANVYGMRQNSEGEAGVVSIFINRLLKGEPLYVLGDGLQTRDFVFVKDVVQANIAALTAGDNEIYNIGTGTRRSVQELVDALRQLVQTDIQVQYVKARKGDIRDSYLDNQKAREQLRWQCGYSFTEGLRLMLAYYEQLRLHEV